MAQQRTFSDFTDPPPSRASGTPTRPGGRLAMPTEQAVDLFRQVVEAFDRADLLAAVSPLKDLRLFGISVKVTLPSRPSQGSRHGQR